jgi:hypothetical protein
MGRNLDLDNCANKQEAVIKAYEQELEENERKIVDEGAWAMTSLRGRFRQIFLKWLRALLRVNPFAPF